MSMIKIFLGSFFIQSSWSFEKMQALGFGAAISPALKEIYGGDAKKEKDALKRHLEFYNAHPYMASPVLGAAINLEEKAAKGLARPEAAARFKKMIMGPYGALGDAFFWGSVRPLASIAGVLAALHSGIMGIFVFLAVYNIFHLWMRWIGLSKGYQLGEEVVLYIKRLDLPKQGHRLKLLSCAALGAGLAVTALAGSGPVSNTLGLALAALSSALVIALVFLLDMLLKKGVSVSMFVYFVIIVFLAYGLVAP